MNRLGLIRTSCTALDSLMLAAYSQDGWLLFQNKE